MTGIDTGPLDPAQCPECRRFIGPDDGRGGPRDQEHTDQCGLALRTKGQET